MPPKDPSALPARAWLEERREVKRVWYRDKRRQEEFAARAAALKHAFTGRHPAAMEILAFRPIGGLRLDMKEFTVDIIVSNGFKEYIYICI